MMHTKHIYNRSGMKLQYYVVGDEHKETIVIVNAPGMSIKFWLPIIENLYKQYRIVGMEYRSYPDSKVELTDAQCNVYEFQADLLLVLDTEKIESAHFVSWCLGGKVMLELYQHTPVRIRSMVGMNIAHREIKKNGSFSGLIYKMIDRLDRNPNSVTDIIALMKSVGTIPNLDLISKIAKEKDDSPVLNLYDFLNEESTFSNLSFYLIDNPIGLRNYLKMFDAFGRNDYTQLIEAVKLPALFMTAEKDNMAHMSAETKVQYADKSNLHFVHVDGASHFMQIEQPRKLARLISNWIERTSAQKQVSAALR
jgi:pimeloyl-ACP methyl ester carboxylesterase